MTLEFQPWPKIHRLKRTIIVTEKIDGTNAQVAIDDEGNVYAGSRSRWVTPDHDNFGFAKWVEANKEELRKLGPGRHYGEWWGQGIQRRYGLEEKRFSLFNVRRWHADNPPPACCSVVPILYVGDNDSQGIEGTLASLRANGSVAAPGFMRPEGVVVFHTAVGSMGKILLENDDISKTEAGAA